MHKPERIGRISIGSDLAADGTYTLTVQAGEDFALPLDRERAFRYAHTVLTAAQYADYEAAVWAQMQAAGPGELGTGLAITALRDRRPALDDKATFPLRFEPILSARTRQGIVRVHLHGAQVAQLETTAATEHAVNVLTTLAVAELDACYYRWLTDEVVGEETARSIIGLLARHHTGAVGGR